MSFTPWRAPSSPHLARGLNKSFFPQFCSGLTAGWAVGWIEDFRVGDQPANPCTLSAFIAKVFCSGGEGVSRTLWQEFSGAATETGNSFGRCLDTVLETPYLLALAHYTEKLF